MRKHYDFSHATKNPYVKKLKQQVTLRIDGGVIDYFKNLSGAYGIPYQSLIDLYIRDCVRKHKKPPLII